MSARLILSDRLKADQKIRPVKKESHRKSESVSLCCGVTEVFKLKLYIPVPIKTQSETKYKPQLSPLCMEKRKHACSVIIKTSSVS